MTPADALRDAEVAGFEFRLDDGQPIMTGPAPGVRPNAALLAALTEHRAGIIEILGGQRPREWCGGTTYKGKPVVCRAWVYEAVDSEAFCDKIGCPFRAKARQAEGPL